MPDLKELYFKMFRAPEQAISILIETQRECGEVYISSSQPELAVVSLPTEKKDADKKQRQSQSYKEKGIALPRRKSQVLFEKTAANKISHRDRE